MFKAHTYHRNVLIRVLLAAMIALLFLNAAPSRGQALPSQNNPTFFTTSPRIVTLYQGATDSAVALGLTPVGVVDSWLEKPTYRYLRAPLEGVEHVGLETQPNLEKIAWLQPDLVMASDFRHARIAPLLTAIAPTVSANSVFDFKTTLTLLAKATDHTAEARELLQRWEARAADFRQQIATELGHHWPQKVAVVRFKSDHVRIYTSGFAGSILTELGFEQPETLQSQSWGMKLSSTENIPVLDADVIFVLLEPNDPAIVDNYQHWTAHPLWQQLAAVQSGRVFEVDPVSWMMGGGILAANAMLDDLYSHYGLDETIVANRDACSLDAYRQVDLGIC
ncbi:ABC transporter substrate-binding protein [Halomonas sp. HAL1]|uniref:ABC transporter substrate-binding protein n=1 Tax=Halomonas sp. HAL1 TaxID=550984 RepID=UPI00022D272E|nr:iron-siderophore ABC transporter substrate-binding protein [Halomonas sp. HAL1]EHA15520.1 ABC transporter periplasmic protein [Halomonas sp. HAL1]WKV92039.1 iron-siderophore ABC transporter substrate-binding protein [Halomonas sp. HAL1]